MCDSDTSDSSTASESAKNSAANAKTTQQKNSIITEICSRQLGYKPNYYTRKFYSSLLSVQNLDFLAQLEGHKGCVNSLNFSFDGQYLATGSDDLKICIWDWSKNKLTYIYDTKHKSNVFQSKFLPISSSDFHIISCARDGQVRIAQISQIDGIRSNKKLASHKAACHKLCIPVCQSNVILSAGEDAEVLQHDLRCTTSEKLVKVTNAKKTPIPLFSIANHPINPHEFLVTGKDPSVQTFDSRYCNTTNTKPLQCYHPFKTNNSSMKHLQVTCAVYNFNGSEILASYNDDDIYMFDAKAPPGVFVHKYQGHSNGATIKGVNYFGLKSEYVISGSDCGNVFIWDSNTEEVVKCFQGDIEGVVNCLEPHPLYPILATSGLDKHAKIWAPFSKEIPNGYTKEEMKDIIKGNRSSDRTPLRYDENGTGLRYILRELWFNEARQMALHMDPGAWSNVNRDTSDSSASDSDDDDGGGDSSDGGGPLGCPTQ